VRQALGVKAGDTIRYVFSEDSVQVLRTRSISEVAGMHARDDLAPVSFDTMETAIADPPICGTNYPSRWTNYRGIVKSFTQEMLGLKMKYLTRQKLYLQILRSKFSGVLTSLHIFR